jgi:hypothetical protein
MSRDSFLERWSRRKLTSGDAEEAGPEPDPTLDEGPAPDAAEAMPAAQMRRRQTRRRSDEEALDEAELARLPPIEKITVKTDLAPFLRKGVPQALKNAAMRKMWMLDPAIRDHKDFAVDYAWDWNTPGGVPGNAGTISGKSLARMLESLNPKPVEAAAVQEAEHGEEPSASDEKRPRQPRPLRRHRRNRRPAMTIRMRPRQPRAMSARPDPPPSRAGMVARCRLKTVCNQYDATGSGSCPASHPMLRHESPNAL